jgi:hypothetical protein
MVRDDIYSKKNRENLLGFLERKLENIKNE